MSVLGLQSLCTSTRSSRLVWRSSGWIESDCPAARSSRQRTVALLRRRRASRVRVGSSRALTSAFQRRPERLLRVELRPVAHPNCRRRHHAAGLLFGDGQRLHRNARDHRLRPVAQPICRRCATSTARKRIVLDSANRRRSAATRNIPKAVTRRPAYYGWTSLRRRFG